MLRKLPISFEGNISQTSASDGIGQVLFRTTCQLKGIISEIEESPPTCTLVIVSTYLIRHKINNFLYKATEKLVEPTRFNTRKYTSSLLPTDRDCSRVLDLLFNRLWIVV